MLHRQLREWALRGRFVRHRARADAKDDSHKWMKFSDADMASLSEQDAILQGALARQQWCALATEEVRQETGDDAFGESESE